MFVGLLLVLRTTELWGLAAQSSRHRCVKQWCRSCEIIGPTFCLDTLAGYPVRSCVWYTISHPISFFFSFLHFVYVCVDIQHAYFYPLHLHGFVFIKQSWKKIFSFMLVYLFIFFHFWIWFIWRLNVWVDLWE